TYLTRAWWHLPLSRQNKERVKGIIFSTFPFIFRKSRAYRNWHEARVFSKRIDKTPVLNQDRRLKEVNPLTNPGVKYQPEPIPNDPVTSLAIIIHAFHFDIFLEIMNYLKNNNGAKFRFYVTSPEDLSEKITGFFIKTPFEYKILSVENRGRDILPFLNMIPQVFNDGYQVILKIHTKKSTHRLSGDLWRKDLYTKLLNETAINRALRIFNTDHTVGLIGTPGHIVPMNLYYGANARLVENLSEGMGIASSQLINLSFSAGSMFYARKQELTSLVHLNLQRTDFEEETGQKDGTTAHAVERAFAVSTAAANLKLVDTLYDPQKQNSNVTKDHPFTH
nr:hypothetical protein [Bacteroidota bacterium]